MSSPVPSILPERGSHGIAESSPESVLAYHCIWHALKQCVDKARKNADHFGVRTVGIDETSTCKGRHYITVVVDAKTGRVIYACPGRGREAVGMFAEDLREHGGDPLAIS